MDKSTAQVAIDHALKGRWKEAKNANLTVLKSDPEDIDALNRLAKAYYELGNITSARNTIKKALKIDPYNPISSKCYAKWKNMKKADKANNGQLSAEMFLEEPGKTKIIHLIHPCDKSVTAKLNCADLVYENTKARRIGINSASGIYIGKLPDDISVKLKKMMKIGFKYVFAIKSIEGSDIKIFIREMYRPPHYSSKASFTSDKIDYISYTPPELVHDKPDMTTLEEESSRIDSEQAQFSDAE